MLAPGPHAVTTLLGVPAVRWRRVCPQLPSSFSHYKVFAAHFRSFLVKFFLPYSGHKLFPSPCARLCLCCAPALAQLRLELHGLALLNTFRPSQSAASTHRERHSSRAPRPSFPERGSPPRHASSQVQRRPHTTTHQPRRRKHDWTEIKCHPMSLHSRARCARHARRIDCLSKAITRGLY